MSPDRRRHAGQAVVAWVLMVPLALTLLGSVADIGLALWAQLQFRQACDLAALAAAQDIDLVRLAHGERWLVTAQAEQDARAYVNANLSSDPRLTGRYRVDVRVLNASPSAPLRHPWSGRELADPTVAVRVSGEIPTLFLRPILPSITVSAAADASVLAHP
ncbi:MAG: hypothetical protein IRZ18_03980 [Clostridia bacterium]|nr:hypothetical protein [Clostridia bacterium]